MTQSVINRMLVSSKRYRGFSLIELSIALLLFLIGVLALLQFLIIEVNLNQRNRDITLSSSLAQAKMEDLMSGTFSSTFAAPELSPGGSVPATPETNPFTSGNSPPVP